VTGRVPDNLGMGSFLRRPLGAFIATLVVGSAILAVGMKAFGGTSGVPYPSAKPLTLKQFNRAGMQMCLSLRPQLEWVIHMKKPRNLREVTRDSRRLSAIADRMTADLHELIPPPSLAARYQRMVRKFDTLDHAIRRLDHLAETRQWRRFVLLVRSRWWKHIGRLFGPPRQVRHIRCGGAGNTFV
jgi:hypothetical protein